MKTYNEALRDAAAEFVNNGLPIPQSLVLEINKAVKMPQTVERETVMDFIAWLKENTYFIPAEVSATALCDAYEGGKT